MQQFVFFPFDNSFQIRLIYSFIPLLFLNDIYITVQHLTVGCLPLHLLLCLNMLMLHKGKFAICHLRPRCPSAGPPQHLAALHCLLVYMGNDPNLELKVQINAKVLVSNFYITFSQMKTLIITWAHG